MWTVHCQNPSNSDSEESELNIPAASDSGTVVTLFDSWSSRSLSVPESSDEDCEKLSHCWFRLSCFLSCQVFWVGRRPLIASLFHSFVPQFYRIILFPRACSPLNPNPEPNPKHNPNPDSNCGFTISNKMKYLRRILTQRWLLVAGQNNRRLWPLGTRLKYQTNRLKAETALQFVEFSTNIRRQNAKNDNN